MNMKGWGEKVVIAALWSPVVRNRNMALKVLESWRVEFWPEKAREILAQLRSNDPNEEVKTRVVELGERLGGFK